MRGNSAKFGVLESWRGVAAIFVVVLHNVFYGHLLFVPFVRNSYLFVDFFFVLSGFVITHAYMDRLSTPTSYASFVIKRFGRLWPLHIVVLSWFVALELFKYFLVEYAHISMTQAPFSGGLSVGDLVANVFLVHSLGFIDHLSWNRPSWSISTEFYAYLVFALAVALTRTRIKLAVASVLICAVCAGVILMYSTGPQTMDVIYNWGFERCLLGFFVGHLTYNLYARYRDTRLPLLGIAELAAVLLVILFVATQGSTRWSVAAPLVFAPVIFIFAFEAGPVSNVLQLKAFRNVGAWSYSIYMTHMFIAQMLVERGAHAVDYLFGVQIFQKVDFGGSIHVVLQTASRYSHYWMDLLTLVFIGIVIAVSSLTYRYVEEPARKFFNRVADGFSRKHEHGLSIRSLPATREVELSRGADGVVSAPD